MRTSHLIKALDSYLSYLACPYPSVIVQSVNVQSCNFSQPSYTCHWPGLCTASPVAPLALNNTTTFVDLFDELAETKHLRFMYLMTGAM